MRSSDPHARSRDTGLAMVLLLLLAHASSRRDGFATAALILLVVAMTVPRVFQPLSVVWFGLSHVLGAVMSRVLLTAVFYAVVTPIGLLRRLFGRDALQLRAFKTSEASVLHERRHRFVAADLENPY